MLFAVEGGGFFSSSASGYSKGLTLLLLGQKNEDNKLMRVLPWNHYQLVDQEPEPDLQLASTKNWISRGFATLVCFGRSSRGLDTTLALKLGPTQLQDTLSGSLVSDKGKDYIPDSDYDNTMRKGVHRSSLRKPSNGTLVCVKNTDESRAVGEERIDIASHTERRRIQWTDACGGDLVDIREFEPSETDGSDYELRNGNERSCSCTIM